MGGLTARSRRYVSGTRALQRAFGVLAVTGICLASAPPALADSAGSAGSGGSAGPGTVDFGLAASSECEFGGDVIKSTPWSLQRILLDQLHAQATGEGVTVAVIDTGVDDSNPQLRDAMASGGKDYVGSTVVLLRG